MDSTVRFHPLDHELVDKSPAVKLRLLKVSPRDQLWTVEQEKAFLSESDPPMRQAFNLQLGTAQRQADVLALRWEDYDGELIKVRQEKTGALVWVPATRKLRMMLDVMERGQGRILLDENGRPEQGPLHETLQSNRGGGRGR